MKANFTNQTKMSSLEYAFVSEGAVTDFEVVTPEAGARYFWMRLSEDGLNAFSITKIEFEVQYHPDAAWTAIASVDLGLTDTFDDAPGTTWLIEKDRDIDWVGAGPIDDVGIGEKDWNIKIDSKCVYAFRFRITQGVAGSSGLKNKVAFRAVAA